MCTAAGPQGIILSSASKELVRTVQIVLLNYGILSSQRPKADGCTHLEIKGASAALGARTLCGSAAHPTATRTAARTGFTRYG